MPVATERRPSAYPLARFARPLSMVGWRSAGDFLLYCLFVGGFVGTLAFFSMVDVYDRHFFESSYAAIYNAFRVIFAAYFFWLVYVVGRQALSFIAEDLLAGMRLHDRLALGFFVGAAVLTIVMLVLGYLSLYWRVVAWAIAVPVIATSYRHFALTVGEARSAIAQHLQDGSRTDRNLSIMMVIATVFAGAALLLVKGLYPQGGHDYYQHYSHFYAAVIDNHSIWPNLFWYQYYLSKGMGVTFLGMLLTDALAPSLVAYCFAVATALALFALVRDFCSHTLWPWLAVVLYLALNVHTLGTGAYFGNGGWGTLSKAARDQQPAHLRGAVDGRQYGALRGRRPPGLVVRCCGMCVCRGVCPACLTADRRAVRRPCRSLVLRHKPRGRQDVPGHRGLDRRWVGFPSGVELPDDRRTGRCRSRYLVADRGPAAIERRRHAFRLRQHRRHAIAGPAVEGSALADGFDLIEYARNVFRFDMLEILIGVALIGWLACMIHRDVLGRRSADSVVTIDTSSRQAVSVVAAFLRGDRSVRVHRRHGSSPFHPCGSARSHSLMIGISAIAATSFTVSLGRSPRVRILASTVAPILLMSVPLVQASRTQDDTARRRAQRASFCRRTLQQKSRYRYQAGCRFSIGRRSIPALRSLEENRPGESVSGASA